MVDKAAFPSCSQLHRSLSVLSLHHLLRDVGCVCAVWNEAPFQIVIVFYASKSVSLLRMNVCDFFALGGSYVYIAVIL